MGRHCSLLLVFLIFNGASITGFPDVNSTSDIDVDGFIIETHKNSSSLTRGHISNSTNTTMDIDDDDDDGVDNVDDSRESRDDDIDSIFSPIVTSKNKENTPDFVADDDDDTTVHNRTMFNAGLKESIIGNKDNLKGEKKILQEIITSSLSSPSSKKSQITTTELTSQSQIGESNRTHSSNNTDADSDVDTFVTSDEKKAEETSTHKAWWEHGRKKTGSFPFTHHLHMVPMDEEPFGAAIWRDERYLVSVLIPIGIGVGGAAAIVITTYTLRCLAQRRQRNEQIICQQSVPGISRIKSEATDQIVLLADSTDEDM